jgi:hypothetical protein
MKNSFPWILWLLLTSTGVQGQTADQLALSFLPVFHNHTISAESYHQKKNGDTIRIDELRFYISGISLWHKGSEVWKEPRSYHLLDITDPSSLILLLDLRKNIAFDEIKFNLGIDSLTNVSGAMEGDLDPVKGMYWTWQSGYINIKLEGWSPVCPTRGHKFQFHLGGYSGAVKAIQEVSLPVKSQQEIIIQFALDAFFEKINLSKHREIMIPSREAVLLSEQLAGAFQTANP